MPDLWQKVPAKSLVWIIQTITPQWLMMSHSELWWQECLLKNVKGKVVDIDNAFLNGDLEHEMYMKIPEGYDEVISKDVDKDDCLILQKAIYGLVQAARQFWKKTVDKMQEEVFSSPMHVV